MTGRIFYWNQTTFERAGIEVPKTFRELLYTGEAFKTKLGDDIIHLWLVTSLRIWVRIMEVIHGYSFRNAKTDSKAN